MLLGQCGDDALSLLLDILREARMPLLDETRGESELEQGNRKSGCEIIEIGARFGELKRFYRLVEELLHCGLQLVIEEFGFGHEETFAGGTKFYRKSREKPRP
jgi:hypothetical protein